MRKKSNNTTLVSIAAICQTSTATVSRVLSGSNYPVSKPLKEKILAVSRSMNYKPLHKLDYGHTPSYDIGVIIPTLSNPFYNELLMGIENECDNRRYIPIVCSSKRNTECESRNIKMLLEKNVNGLIISSLSENHTYLSSLNNLGNKIVLFDQSVVNDDMSFVKFDHFEAGRLATEYLLLHGHRNICFASPPITREIRRDLYNGYKHALESFNIGFNAQNILTPRAEKDASIEMYDYINGIEMAKQFLDLYPRPTAVFTINDSTAYGMIKCFMSMGLRVPEDVSIIGCDDLFTSEMSCPPLTTIHQPGYETGKLTCQILLDLIENKNVKPSHIVLHPSLVERESVKTIS